MGGSRPQLYVRGRGRPYFYVYSTAAAQLKCYICLPFSDMHEWQSRRGWVGGGGFVVLMMLYYEKQYNFSL